MVKESLLDMLHPYKWERNIFSKTLDATCIIGVMALICAIFDRPFQVQALAAISAAILFQLFAEIGELYRRHRGEQFRRELVAVCCVWMAVIFCLLLLGYAFKSSSQFSRLAIILWMMSTPLLLCSWRFTIQTLTRRQRRKGHNLRIAAVAGASENGARVAQIIERERWMGFSLLGVYDDREQAPQRIAWDGPIEGDFDQLIEQARNRSVDIIYIALPFQAAERIHDLINRLADCTTSVYVVPEPFWTEIMRGRWINLGSLPTVSIFETPFNGLNGWLKRLEDIILGSVILTLTFIPMLMIGLAVWLTSPGPVLFKQRRYGLDGREIEIWKFRTMRVCEDGAVVKQATHDDKRFTRIGRFLRKTSLDELPQFINVMQGTMSIVGPRPHAVTHNEHYRSIITGYMLRHKVPPGITGWAQINGWRGETRTVDKMEARIKHDLWYIQNWSFWLDIKIILLTIFRGFSGKNAF